MATVQFYTRRGCHLCEIMLEELLPLIRGKVEIELRDVDSEPGWLSKYNDRVPVVEADGQWVSGYPLDYNAVRAFLVGLSDDGD